MGQKFSKTKTIFSLSATLVCCMSWPLACQRRTPVDCAEPQPDEKRCRIVRKHAGPASVDAGASRAAKEVVIPNVSLAELSPTERLLFFDVVDDQFDPCGHPRSFGETLRAHQGDCPVAAELARFVVRRVRAGDERRVIVLRLLERLRRQHNRSTFRLEGRPRLGPADAKVTVVEFYDYECPYCREVQGALEQVVRRFPQAALVAEPLPIEAHAGARPAAKAALAAHGQGKFWEMHAALFRRSASLDEAALLASAKEVGLDLARFAADRAAVDVETLLREDREDADRALVEGTPSFWIDGVEVLFEDLEATLREKLSREEDR